VTSIFTHVIIRSWCLKLKIITVDLFSSLYPNHGYCSCCQSHLMLFAINNGPCLWAMHLPSITISTRETTSIQHCYTGRSFILYAEDFRSVWLLWKSSVEHLVFSWLRYLPCAVVDVVRTLALLESMQVWMRFRWLREASPFDIEAEVVCAMGVWILVISCFVRSGACQRLCDL
jgi:hypothetical protein